MCGRVIQSSGPLHYGVVEGMDARIPASVLERRAEQDLLVIRCNHETDVVSLDP